MRIGKSQCALEYIYQNKGDYERVYWITAVNQASILSGYDGIARAANIQMSARVVIAGHFVLGQVTVPPLIWPATTRPLIGGTLTCLPPKYPKSINQNSFRALRAEAEKTQFRDERSSGNNAGNSIQISAFFHPRLHSAYPLHPSAPRFTSFGTKKLNMTYWSENKNSFFVSAPGKVILFGEHAVVHEKVLSTLRNTSNLRQ